MRDLNYLNLVYENLEEGVGIRTTKLKPFYDNANGYESQRNPRSDHRELKHPQRRQVKYDYGKANYEEISAEDAIRLVQQDKHNIQKLRIIYDLSDSESLVEYEVRDNGSVYAIYGSGYSVSIDGKVYKNIRYAPWKKVIENADLIYVTDEYDKFLDDDSLDRKSRYDYVQLPLYADKAAPDYDPHAIYANTYRKGNKNSYGFPVRYAAFNPDTGSHNIGKRYHDNVANTLSPYINAQKHVKDIYPYLDRYRRALKKLEQDKDSLDEDEYNQKKERWKNSYNEYLNEYKEAIAQLKKIEAKVDKEIDMKSAEFAKKLHDNVYEYDAALTKGFKLSQQIQELKSKLTGDVAEIPSKYQLKEASKQLEKASIELIGAKTYLEELLNNMENDENTIATAQDQVIAAADVFSNHLKSIDTLKLDELNQNLKQIDTIGDQLREIDKTLATLRPKAAAEKQARAAKNKTAELDPELINIIDFEDDSNTSEEETVA